MKGKDGKPHRGYYWLAYDWRNLIPCCSKCNTGGKLEYFPIAGDRVFVFSEELDIATLNSTEKPLLLYPYSGDENNPRNHLTFSNRGYVKARKGSKKGRVSIEVYGLRRKDLRKQRHESQVHAWNKFEKLLDAPSPRRLAFLQRFVDAKEEHSSAVADYILYKLDELASERKLLALDS